MEITRNDIVGDGLKKIRILDFKLNNSEAAAASVIAAILAAEVTPLMPPAGPILAALIAADGAEILSKNQGRGVGANVHYQVFPPALIPGTAIIKKEYFSL